MSASLKLINRLTFTTTTVHPKYIRCQLKSRRARISHMSKHRRATSLKIDPRRFQKYELTYSRWRTVGTPFSIAQYLSANEGDEVAREIARRLARLAAGASFNYDGGAAGEDKFKRVK